MTLALKGDPSGLVTASKAGEKAVDGLEKSVKGTGEAIDKKLVPAVKTGEKAINGLSNSTKDAGRKADVLGKESAEAARDVDVLGKSSRASGKEVEGFGGKAEKAARSAGSLGRASRTIQATGKALAWGSSAILNQYTAMAGGFGAAAAVISVGKLDKTLTNIRLTAGATRQDANLLRQDLFRMASETGAGIDDLAGGFNNLVQSGESWGAARQEIDAINTAMAVSGASAEKLSGGLSVASKAFNFDLSKPGLALQLLDKMTVAGRQGNAELENLSDIFARVGPGASAAGMSFDKTLAFIEGLSMQERNPERLSTLADSTLRLFTNMNYLQKASKATGVKFFDVNGNRRDAVDILSDLRGQFNKFKTDQQRSKWMQKAFGQADLDTQRGLRIIFGGNILETMRANTKELSSASGTLKRDTAESIDNLIDQAGRFKAVMQKAGQEFAKPVTDALTRGIQWALRPKDQGGSGWTGSQMLLGGAGVLGGAALLARFGGGMAAKIGGGATGVAAGKALEATTGVTPVFVVNMPGGSGLAGASAAASRGATAAEGAAAQVAKRGLLSRAGGWIASATPGWIKTAGGFIGATAKGAVRSGRELASGFGGVAEQWAYQHGVKQMLSRAGGYGTSALRLGGKVVGGSAFGAALALPYELYANKDKRRAVIAAAGTGIGGFAGGAIPVPGLNIATGIGGSLAGREVAVRLYDLLAGEAANRRLSDTAAQATASARANDARLNPSLSPFQPSFTIYNSVDSQGRTSTRVEGPGALGVKVQSLGSLTPPWAGGF